MADLLEKIKKVLQNVYEILEIFWKFWENFKKILNKFWRNFPICLFFSNKLCKSSCIRENLGGHVPPPPKLKTVKFGGGATCPPRTTYDCPLHLRPTSLVRPPTSTAASAPTCEGAAFGDSLVGAIASHAP